MIDDNKKEISEEMKVPYLPDKDYDSESDSSSDRESSQQEQQKNVTHQAILSPRNNTLSPRNILPQIAKPSTSI